MLVWEYGQCYSDQVSVSGARLKGGSTTLKLGGHEGLVVEKHGEGMPLYRTGISYGSL